MRSIYSLNEMWDFELLHDEIDESVYMVSDPQIIDLPHSWNDETHLHRGKALYQKRLNVPDIHLDQELFLEFLGANSVCRVYLNGIFLGEHRGGYATFHFSITNVFSKDNDNLLSVYVDNSKTDDVSPLEGDFTIYGGLYRSVNLIGVDKTHYDLEYWGTNGIVLSTSLTESREGRIEIEAHTVLAESAVSRFEIWNADGVKVSDIKVSADQIKTEIMIHKPVLWEAKRNPYLYTLRALLESEGGLCDLVELNFGFKSCQMTEDQGFYLNGSAFPIQGVCRHQDFAGVGNGISREMMEQDMALIEEIGANAIRLSHYQHDAYFYDLCDHKGLVVWTEIPMLAMSEDSRVIDNARQQLKELLYQNMHHPSICFWGIQNEIAMNGESLFMYRSVDELNQVVHDILPDGLTASANMYYVKNSSQLNQITDMQGYNLYYGWYYGETADLETWIDQFHLENPEIALGFSEYGADCNVKFHGDEPRVKDYSEEYQALYHEQTYRIITSKPFLWGSFLWAMFDFGSAIRDEGGIKGLNTKGLISFDRQIKKDAFYYYKAKWSKDPFVHICGRRYKNREKQKIVVKVYSNQPSVSLQVNGDVITELKSEDVFLFDDILLQDGDNHIVAIASECEDRVCFTKVEQADTSYVFRDPNPGINVKNWFTQKAGEVDLFPSNRYSILDPLRDLMADPAAWELVRNVVPAVAEWAVPGTTVTLLWAINKMRSLYTEDDVKKLNEGLNQIEKRTR